MRTASRHHQTLLPLLAGGAGGLVRNGLVAEYRFDESRNLLKYSQQFDNAAWVKQRSSVTANATTAPDGTTTADALIEDSTAGNTHQMQEGVTLDDNTVYTLSIHVKASTRSYIMLNLIDKNNTSRYAFFDLSSGIVLGTYGTISQTITAMSDGWYRCCVTANSNSGATSPVYQIRLSATGLSSSYNGDGTSGIYIWGAQLEQGSVARTYVKTTDKQLLMDYSRPRKNLLLPNQANACEDGKVPFTKLTAGDAVTASAGEVDEWQGTYCAKVDTANAAANEGIYTTDIIYNLKPSTAYTASGYIRGATGGETVKLGLRETTDAGATVDTTGSDTLTLTTDWQRVTVSRTFGTTGRGARLLVYTPTQQNIVFYVDGLQLEEGSTATAWEAPPNIGICGSTTGADTNDPTWTGQGASLTTDDYINCGAVTNPSGTTQIGNTITLVFYTGTAWDKSTTVFAPISFNNSTDANNYGYISIGAASGGLTDEIITVMDKVSTDANLTGWCDNTATIAIGWHTITIAWNGASYDIYLDGSKKTTTAYAGHARQQTISKLVIGALYSNSTFLWNATFVPAHLTIYSRALTQAEITQNYNYLKGYLLRERGISI